MTNTATKQTHNGETFSVRKNEMNIETAKRLENHSVVLGASDRPNLARKMRAKADYIWTVAAIVETCPVAILRRYSGSNGVSMQCGAIFDYDDLEAARENMGAPGFYRVLLNAETAINGGVFVYFEKESN